MTAEKNDLGLKEAKPAIILITCDQLNRNTLGCYGGKTIQTPHIDRLAEEGTVCSRCYTVSPWCLPARCAMLSGLYPHRNRAYSNFRKCALDTGRDNLFFALKDSGYHTSLFGKCHFAPVPYDRTRPDATLPYEEFREYYQSLGIDELRLQDDKQVSAWFLDDYSRELDRAGYLTPYREAVWNPEYQKVFPFPGPACWHPDAWVGDQAAGSIRRYDQKKPLFAWVSFSGPHFPFDAPQEYADRIDRSRLPERIRREGEFAGMDRIHHDSYYGGDNGTVIDGARPAKGKGCRSYTEEYWDRMRTRYYANVKLIDDQVGKIEDAVRERYGDNALILFTADHGEMLGNHGLWGKNMCAYDEVWRIPLLIRYPGNRKRAVEERLVNSTDFLPTCLGAAGGRQICCDGNDLADSTWSREYTFAEGEGFMAVTDGLRKYIHLQRQNGKKRELIDLMKDPHEFDNRVSWPEYQAEAAHLEEKMLEHMIPSVLA